MWLSDDVTVLHRFRIGWTIGEMPRPRQTGGQLFAFAELTANRLDRPPVWYHSFDTTLFTVVSYRHQRSLPYRDRQHWADLRVSPRRLFFSYHNTRKHR